MNENLAKDTSNKQRIADANKALDDYAKFIAQMIEKYQSVLFKQKD